ncbi:MAG: response regulator transcription factor, partial [Rhodocyclaceae bacterium]|nr:response regulator transcription factor [Rhodocyclaceae bacterium]
MNILLVDDHVMFREGLRLLLANISQGVAIEEASTLEQAIEVCSRISIRIVLLDLGLSSSSGLETLRMFRAAITEVPVVVLSGDQEPSLIREALEIGAAGFVPKAYTSEAMIAALRLILAGGIYLPPRVLHAEPARPGDSSGGNLRAGGYARLSERQKEVAQLLLQGFPNKVIARRLDVSEGTIKAHV